MSCGSDEEALEIGHGLEDDLLNEEEACAYLYGRNSSSVRRWEGPSNDSPNFRKSEPHRTGEPHENLPLAVTQRFNGPRPRLHSRFEPTFRANNPHRGRGFYCNTRPQQSINPWLQQPQRLCVPNPFASPLPAPRRGLLPDPCFLPKQEHFLPPQPNFLPINQRDPNYRQNQEHQQYLENPLHRNQGFEPSYESPWIQNRLQPPENHHPQFNQWKRGNSHSFNWNSRQPYQKRPLPVQNKQPSPKVRKLIDLSLPDPEKFTQQLFDEQEAAKCPQLTEESEECLDRRSLHNFQFLNRLGPESSKEESVPENQESTPEGLEESANKKIQSEHTDKSSEQQKENDQIYSRLRSKSPEQELVLRNQNGNQKFICRLGRKCSESESVIHNRPSAPERLKESPNKKIQSEQTDKSSEQQKENDQIYSRLRSKSPEQELVLRNQNGNQKFICRLGRKCSESESVIHNRPSAPERLEESLIQKVQNSSEQKTTLQFSGQSNEKILSRLGPKCSEQSFPQIQTSTPECRKKSINQEVQILPDQNLLPFRHQISNKQILSRLGPKCSEQEVIPENHHSIPEGQETSVKEEVPYSPDKQQPFNLHQSQKCRQQEKNLTMQSSQSESDKVSELLTEPEQKLELNLTEYSENSLTRPSLECLDSETQSHEEPESTQKDLRDKRIVEEEEINALFREMREVVDSLGQPNHQNENSAVTTKRSDNVENVTQSLDVDERYQITFPNYSSNPVFGLTKAPSPEKDSQSSENHQERYQFKLPAYSEENKTSSMKQVPRKSVKDRLGDRVTENEEMTNDFLTPPPPPEITSADIEAAKTQEQPLPVYQYDLLKDDLYLSASDDDDGHNPLFSYKLILDAMRRKAGKMKRVVVNLYRVFEKITWDSLVNHFNPSRYNVKGIKRKSATTWTFTFPTSQSAKNFITTYNNTFMMGHVIIVEEDEICIE